MAREMLLSVLLGGLLAGCVAGPDHVRPDSAPRPSCARPPTRSPPLPRRAGGEIWGDPQLDALVARALADAPAIDAAEARVRQARAGVSSARAGLLPALSASATYIYADLPNGALGGSMGNIDLTNVGFDAQWEADLWGGKLVRDRARGGGCRRGRGGSWRTSTSHSRPKSRAATLPCAPGRRAWRCLTNAPGRNRG